MHAASWTLRKSLVGALGGPALALTLMALPASASASTSTVVPVTTFTVTSQQCAGGAQSQLVGDVQNELVELEGYKNTIPVPTVSLNPGCTAAPSALAPVLNASTTTTGSPSGSATVSASALGNAALTETAQGNVDMTASIPLSAPASSVEVTIPYSTTGVTWTPGGEAEAGVGIVPSGTPTMCADGSYGAMEPYYELGVIDVTSLSTPTPPGSGTVTGIQFLCPDGSDLVSGVGFTVWAADYVYSSSGQTESASANFAMHDVTATIDS